jgi:glycosyltransferase involved in cell wall biosynthesis
MKLLLVHRYIRPDTPGYAHMLYIMGQRLAADGHEVTIFSAQPSYNDAYDGPPLPRKQTIDGMTIIRTPLLKENKKNSILRAVNFLIFSFSLFCHAFFRIRAYDLMTVTTFPPTLMGFVARSIGFFRKTKYIYHCMDLYPEVAQTSGILKRPWVGKIAAAIDRRNCKKAQTVVVLSEDMLETVRKRGIATDNVRVINNFIIDQVNPEIEVPDALKNRSGKFRVLFAGNIGRFQSLDTIVEAAKKLKDTTEIEFWFVGSGVMVEKLKQQAGELLGTSIFFHPYLPIETVMSVIAQSNLGIVSLTPGVIECAYPSKTMSYLEAGCKLLTLVEADSNLAKFVIDEELGVVCGAPEHEQVAYAIRTEFEKWKSEGANRDKIREVGRSHFSQEVILETWSKMLS